MQIRNGLRHAVKESMSCLEECAEGRAKAGCLDKEGADTHHFKRFLFSGGRSWQGVQYWECVHGKAGDRAKRKAIESVEPATMVPNTFKIALGRYTEVPVHELWKDESKKCRRFKRVDTDAEFWEGTISGESLKEGNTACCRSC